jgi:hypothetical protein
MANARCPQCRSVAHFQTNLDDPHRRRERYVEDEDGFLRIDLCLVCGWGGIERSVDEGGYYNRELPAVRDEWPRMGRLCPHCNLRIPRFLDLAPETAAQARKLTRTSMVSAISLIHETTGCGIRWAQLWAEHPDGPRKPVPRKGPPCVYCGEPLVSEESKQCLECGMDWHDPGNVRRLD